MVSIITPQKQASEKVKMSFGDRLKRMPWFFGEHAFLTVLVLILIDLIIGTLMFYNFGILPDYESKTPKQSQYKFNSGSYQQILDKWGVEAEEK